MRCFVALPIPEALLSALERLLDAVPAGHAQPAENLHLTLAFLDEQPDAMVEAAHEALETIRFPRFPLQPKGLGTFGDRQPHTLWAGIADPGPVEALHRKVLSALHGAGLELPRRRFRPHVTLARLPRLSPDEEARLANFLSKQESFPAPEAEAAEFALYRSTPGKGGPVYDILAAYPLTGADGPDRAG